MCRELPSPKKRFPEFSHPKSDDNTVLSGDDSDGWEKEEDWMIALMTAKNLEEDKAAAAMEDEVDEVAKWMLPLVEEGNPDPAPEDMPKKPENPVEYEVVTFTLKNTVAELKDVAAQLKLSKSGAKKDIFARI